MEILFNLYSIENGKRIETAKNAQFYEYEYDIKNPWRYANKGLVVHKKYRLIQVNERRDIDMVKSTVYGKVTYKQINDMKHCLGFDNKKVTGTKNRKYESYRNYSFASESDRTDWDFLISIGFAEKHKDERYYSVTDDGRTFLEYVTGVKILQEIS